MLRAAAAALAGRVAGRFAGRLPASTAARGYRGGVGASAPGSQFAGCCGLATESSSGVPEAGSSFSNYDATFLTESVLHSQGVLYSPIVNAFQDPFPPRPPQDSGRVTGEDDALTVVSHMAVNLPDPNNFWQIISDSSNVSMEIDIPYAHLPRAIYAIKRTYQPSTLVRKRRHGFRARSTTVGGRRVILRRRMKGRRKVSA
eukprot:jgi/Chlat1/4300/Chrsp29S04383